MKKLVLFLFALLICGFGIAQTTGLSKTNKESRSQFSPTVGLIDEGTDYTPSFGVYEGNSVPDVMSVWALPSTGSTSANSRIPRNASMRYQREIYLITPAEMAASGYPANTIIDAIGFLIGTAGVNTQTGTLTIYLRNTTDVTYTLGSNWTTAGFTMVSTNASWTVPIAAGAYTIPFVGGTPFTYTNSGVYVAWEFSNPAGTCPSVTSLIALCNTTQASMCYGYQSATAQGTALTVTAWRPATQFINNSLTDVLQVTNIYAQEKCPVPYGVPTNLTARVANVSASAETFSVTMTITDQATSTVRYTNTQSVTSLAGGAASVVTFTPWTASNQENVNITVAVPAGTGETFTVNNTKVIPVNINSDLFGYCFTPTPSTGYGYTYNVGTGGIFAAKFHMNGSGSIPAANLLIYNYAANVGNTIYAVVLNSAGVIVGQSENLVIASGDLGTNKNFTFPSEPSFSNEDFYVGLAQPVGGTAQWYPMGCMAESPYRADTYYSFEITGGTPTLDAIDYKYLIEAVVGPPPSVANPSAFAATVVSPNEIDLGWALNANGNTVLVAWSPDGNFGTPSGSAYTPGSSISGYGTGIVLQYDNSLFYNHEGLNPNTTYYYKAWSYNGSIYSAGTIANATTPCTETVAPWTEDFELTTFPPTCWDINTGSAVWDRSPDASGYGTGTASAFADFYNTSGAVPFALFTLPFNKGTLIAPMVSFDYAYATFATEVDEMDVYYSIDGGANFLLLMEMPGGLTGILNTGGATADVFVPTAAQWKTQTITLPVGTNMVAFNAISAYGNNLYLDNVKIIEGYAHDVATSSIDNISSSVVMGTPYTPKATVTNNGLNTESFMVTLTSTPAGYSSTKPVSGLAPGLSVQVTFDDWTPAALGSYSFQACTDLLPVVDENPLNNCASFSTTAFTTSWSSGSGYPATTYMGTGVGYTDNSVSPPVGYLFSLGGNTTSTLGTECYKYNTTTNTWSAIASLPVKRLVAACANVGNYIYLIGGSDGTVYTNTIYRYDIVNDLWTLLPATLPKTIGWGKAVGYGTNYIYLAGGLDAATGGVAIADVYVYDIAAGTWAAATSMPGAKFGGAFSLTGNTLVYVAGADLTVITSTVFVGTINPGNPLVITGWGTMSPYPGLPGKPIIISGDDLTGLMATKPVKGNGPVPMVGYPAGTMFRFDGAPWGTDGVIVAGGSPTSAWTPANPNPCFVYKPATDTWIAQPNVPIPVVGASTGSVDLLNAGTHTWKLILASGYTGAVVTTATQILTEVMAPATKTLTVTAYLEGLYIGGSTMAQALDENGPHFDPGIADKVIVELHDGGNYSNILYSSGLVALSTSGIVTVSDIPSLLSGPCFITIRHRNSIETTSAAAVSFAGAGPFAYNFSSGSSQAYLDNLNNWGGLGVFVIWGGDVNQDGSVDTGDMNDVENESTAFASGYLPADANGDGFVDTSDMNIVENNSTAFIMFVAP